MTTPDDRSPRCYKFYGDALTQPLANERCRRAGASVGLVGNLATITSWSEYMWVKAMSKGAAWVGLFDKTDGKNCPQDRTCADWTWYSGEPTTFLVSTQGQTMWDYPGRVGNNAARVGNQPWGNCALGIAGAFNEPNNWPRCTKTDTTGEGEHGVGFMVGGTGYALNDWRRTNVFPYLCEVQRAHYTTGDYVETCFESCTGAATVNITRLADPVATRPSSFSTELVLAGAQPGRQEVNTYLNCRYPPGLYNVVIKDNLGRISNSFPFNLQDISVTIAAPIGAQSVFNNDTLALSWVGTGSPITTSPEFARLQLLQECIGMPNGAAPAPLPLGAPVAASRLMAVAQLLPLPGCTSNSYLIRAQPVGCAPEYSAKLVFGPYSLSPRPETFRLLSPACPFATSTNTWYPGLPLLASFALENAGQATAVTVALTATVGAAVVRRTLPAQAGAATGSLDLGALYPTMAAWSAAWAPAPAPPAFTIRLTSSTSSSASLQSCSVSVVQPTVTVGVAGLAPSCGSATASTLYGDRPVAVTWNDPRTCASGRVALNLLRSGVPVASAGRPITGIAALGYQWAIPAPVFVAAAGAGVCGGEPAYTIALQCCTNSDCSATSFNATSAASFALAQSLVATGPVGGQLVWPGRTVAFTWTARAGLCGTLTFQASSQGSPSVTLASGVSAAAGFFNYNVAYSDVSTLGGAGGLWAVASITATLVPCAASAGGSAISVGFPLPPACDPLPLPAPLLVAAPPNTGFTASGTKIAAGGVDSRWTYSFNPTVSGNFPTATASSPSVFTVSNFQWPAASSASQWIVGSAGGRSQAPGYHKYSSTFSVADPANTIVAGTWACDDTCSIYINGNLAPVPTANYKTMSVFSIKTGFVTGTNTIQVVVWNGWGVGSAWNPHGLNMNFAPISQPPAPAPFTGKCAPSTSTAIVQRFLITFSQPVLALSQPACNDTMIIGQPFTLRFDLGVPAPAPTPVVSMLDVDLTITNQAASSAVTSQDASYGAVAAAAAARSSGLVALPASLLSSFQLNVDVDLVSAGLTSALFRSEPLFSSAQLALSNALGSLDTGSSVDKTVVLANNSFGGCSVGRSNFIRATLKSGTQRVPLTGASAPATTCPFTVLSPVPSLIDMQPAVPMGSVGMLYSESSYNIRWSLYANFSCDMKVDVVLAAGPLPPADGVAPGWGPAFTTEVIIPSVSAIGANATWNFTSRDRTWWQRIPPTEKYYLALVTTDSARRVLTYTGPFYLSRSALAFARDPALNPGAATLRVRYGELVQLPILAVGYVNRPLSLNLFVQAETTALVPWWSTSLRTPQAVTLNATRYNALAGAANRAFTSDSSFSLSWSAWGAGLPAVIRDSRSFGAPGVLPPLLRVQEDLTGVVSGSDAVAACNTCVDGIAAAFENFPLVGTAAPPTNPAPLQLRGVGELSVLLEMPTMLVSIVPPSPNTPVPSSLAAGSPVSINITLVHTWLSSLPGVVKVYFASPSGATVEAAACAVNFPHTPSGALVVDTSVCTTTVPTTFAAFGAGFSVQAVETGSGSAAVSPTFSIFNHAILALPQGAAPNSAPLALTAGQPWSTFAFCLSAAYGGAATPAALQALTFTLGLSTPARPGVMALAPGTAPSFVQSGAPAACKGGAYWTQSLGIVPLALPAQFVGFETYLAISITPTGATADTIAAAATAPIYSFEENARVGLVNAFDPLGTTYEVKDLVQGRRQMYANVTLRKTLLAALVAQGATLRVQVHCPGYAKAGYGYVDPWWSTKQSWSSFNWGPSSLFATSYRSWSSWWSPSFYDSAAVDYKCGNDPNACASWAGPDGVKRATALFIDPGSVNREQVVATVGRVSLASFASASMSTASTTVLLDIAGAWDKISFSNGACYLRTVTNSSSMIKMPSVQSGRGICTSPGVCTELVEGEWGKAPNLFFSPMFSFAPSVKTFPVTVSLPPGNLGGSYLVSGDTAKVMADLTSFPLTAAGASATNPVLPASVNVELRARGFRGESLVGTSTTVPLSGMRTLPQGPPYYGKTMPVRYNSLAINAVPAITRWSDRGEDGLTYANWGESNSEATSFSMRVRDTNWAAWTYSDSSPFAFCEWPAIDATRMTRRLPEGAAAYPEFLNPLDAYVQNADPERPFTSWQPLLSLGDATTVMLRQYNVGDAVSAMAFGVKCMNAVNFYIATHVPATGTTTVLAPIQECQNLATTVYTPTVTCNFNLTMANSMSVPAGTPLVVRATGADGRGESLSLFFTVFNPTPPPPPPHPRQPHPLLFLHALADAHRHCLWHAQRHGQRQRHAHWHCHGHGQHHAQRHAHHHHQRHGHGLWHAHAQRHWHGLWHGQLHCLCQQHPHPDADWHGHSHGHGQRHALLLLHGQRLPHHHAHPHCLWHAHQHREPHAERLPLPLPDALHLCHPHPHLQRHGHGHALAHGQRHLLLLPLPNIHPH